MPDDIEKKRQQVQQRFLEILHDPELLLKAINHSELLGKENKDLIHFNTLKELHQAFLEIDKLSGKYTNRDGRLGNFLREVGFTPEEIHQIPIVEQYKYEAIIHEIQAEFYEKFNEELIKFSNRKLTFEEGNLLQTLMNNKQTIEKEAAHAIKTTIESIQIRTAMIQQLDDGRATRALLEGKNELIKYQDYLKKTYHLYEDKQGKICQNYDKPIPNIVKKKYEAISNMLKNIESEVNTPQQKLAQLDKQLNEQYKLLSTYFKKNETRRILSLYQWLKTLFQTLFKTTEGVKTVEKVEKSIDSYLNPETTKKYRSDIHTHRKKYSKAIVSDESTFEKQEYDKSSKNILK